MSVALRFMITLMISFIAFTAGWFLRGYMDASPKESYNPDMIPSQNLDFSVKNLNDNKKDFLVKQNPETSLPLKPAEKPLELKKPKDQQKLKTPVTHKKDKPPIEMPDIYKKQNLAQILKIKGNVFYVKGKYSFLVNGFSREAVALKYVKTLKRRYPNWSIFIKRSQRGYLKIYLGPFETKEKATRFIKNFGRPLPFPNYILENQGL